MAEDEIIKHTKAAYNAWKAPDKSVKHKLQEILIEVLIIVFAVTISIWLHNWSDGLQDRKEEKKFLAGMKQDLAGDVANMDSSVAFYQNQLQGMAYFSKVGAGMKIENDSFRKYANIFLSSTDFEPLVSRYEGLKGSGKFKIIENDSLLNSIIQLHEETLQHVMNLNKIYYAYNNDRVVPYLNEHLALDSVGRVANAEVVLRSSQMRFYMAYDIGIISENILQSYTNAIDECKNMMKQIDAEE
jgi:hypothetical protein